MKKENRYFKVKWTAFFLTVLVLTFSLAGIYIDHRRDLRRPEQAENENQAAPAPAGHYSNERFGELISERLSALGIVRDLRFQGEADGYFTISATLTEPGRLTALFAELKPFEKMLTALDGERVMLKGHVGETEEGNGCFMADTIACAGYRLPAAALTPYIESHTDLNELLAVPFEQIELNEAGISFRKAIQTALYKSSRLSAPLG